MEVCTNIQLAYKQTFYVSFYLLVLFSTFSELLIHSNRVWFMVAAVLPPDIGNLTSLTQLWLIDLQLDTLPSSIGRLTRLQKLSVRSNRLLFLPPTFPDLVSLQWLNLSENCLTELPDRFGALKHLAFLNLDSNRLTWVPECLGSLRGLTSLSLRKNRIRAVPEKLVAAFARLSKVDLRDTEIDVPPEQWKVVDFLVFITINLG